MAARKVMPELMKRSEPLRFLPFESLFFVLVEFFSKEVSRISLFMMMMGVGGSCSWIGWTISRMRRGLENKEFGKEGWMMDDVLVECRGGSLLWARSCY